MATLNRDELYKQVWEEPMTKLALKYNISDVGLRKICIAMGVPTPRAGYWAKIQAGKKEPHIPLPPFDSQKHLSTYTISFKRKETLIPDDEIAEFLKPVGAIVVPEKVKSFHPLIRETKVFFSRTSPDRTYGVIERHRGCPDIRVSKNQLERTLRIFDTICRTFDKLSLKVENEKENKGTFVIINGEKVRFLMEERLRQMDHALTAEDKISLKKYPYHSLPKFDYHPTGELSIRIDEYCNGCRKKWRDGEKRIEDQLEDFFRGVFIIAAGLKKRTIEMEAQSRKWREEQERQEAERLRIVEEQKRYGELERQADSFHRSRKIRDYVAHVKNVLIQQRTNIEELQKFAVWEKWTLEYAQSLEIIPPELR